jgi:phage protein D
VLDFGKTMEISIGAADSAHVIFSGAISAIEATHRAGALPTAIVYAEDKLMQLRLTRRMRTYRDVTDGDIAEAIAREHGLQASADAPGPRYDVVQQWNQSDLAFLRERARLIQAEVWVADETLHFATRGNRTATTLSLVAGDELLEVQLRADLAHQRTGVHVSGYDAQQRAAVDESSGADAIQAEIAGGRTGPAILEQAFGARVSYRVRSDPFVADEARAWAKGEMLRRSRAFVSVTGTTNGSADMMVGSTLSLDRVGTPFNGDGYYVTRVSHTYDLTEGFRTHFDAERATVNA